jgi:acyl-CoA thioester hydrolase
MFEIRFEAGWFHCDANRHLKDMVFLEYAIEARFRYFDEHGFPASAFANHQISAVVLRDKITYKRELHLLNKSRCSSSLPGSTKRTRTISSSIASSRRTANLPRTEHYGGL